MSVANHKKNNEILEITFPVNVFLNFVIKFEKCLLSLENSNLHDY